MALINYFKVKKFPLPDPEGPLSTHIHNKCIKGTNKHRGPLSAQVQNYCHVPLSHVPSGCCPEIVVPIHY